MTTRVRIELAHQCGDNKVEVTRLTSTGAEVSSQVAAVIDAERPSFEDVVYAGCEFSVREIPG